MKNTGEIVRERKILKLRDEVPEFTGNFISEINTNRHYKDVSFQIGPNFIELQKKKYCLISSCLAEIYQNTNGHKLYM